MQTNNNVIRSIQKFIQIPSPSGQEEKTANYLKNLMIKLNYDDVYIDEWGNVIGIINGKSSETILLEGHMDAVNVDNQTDWKYAPYGAQIKQGRIYGRGSSDMKSALIIMVYAAADFNNNSIIDKNIVVAGTVQEELFEGVAQANIIDEIKPDLVVIGEASDLNLCIGQRGRAELKITTYGKNAHSSSPEKGINSIKKMIKLLNTVQDIKVPEDSDLGKGILEVVDIKSKPYPAHSVIPNLCLATIDRRLLHDEDKEFVLKPLKNIIKKLKNNDTDFKAKVEIADTKSKTYTGKSFQAEKFFPGWKFNEENSLIKSIYNNLKSEKPETKLDYYSFCTNGSYSAGKQNILTVGYGPSQEELAHIVDEYIEIEQIEKAYQGYINIIETFLNNNV
ncbi:MAG: YgeY family selenium metabolism-linked hydrolase [Candidatus Cloacimonetes bacterium]|nr:YgeY family selenium metabolism-linked hydrolase [Candidatus Cloacimonadota bacterium]